MNSDQLVQVVVMAMAATVAVLSYWPVRNMASSKQVMNYSFNPLRVANTYGLFGRITRQRYEVVIEGPDDEKPADTIWKEYEFKAKAAIPAAARARSRPTTCASTGSCGSSRSLRPTPRAGSSAFS